MPGRCWFVCFHQQSFLFLDTALTKLLTSVGHFLILFLAANGVQQALCFQNKWEMTFLLHQESLSVPAGCLG